MWKIIGTFDDSNDTGKRIAYTVEIANNCFISVMNCVDQDNLFYAMQLADGKLAYDRDGNSYDVVIKEEDLIAFVKRYTELEPSFIAFVRGKLMERGDSDITISNMRFFSNGAMFADVSYTWVLHSWKKHTEHRDWIAVFKDNQWHSPYVF